jgi:hypothetical protein
MQAGSAGQDAARITVAVASSVSSAANGTSARQSDYRNKMAMILLSDSVVEND